MKDFAEAVFMDAMDMDLGTDSIPTYKEIMLVSDEWAESLEVEKLENEISQGLQWWELLNWVGYDRKWGKSIKYMKDLVNSLREHRTPEGDAVLHACSMYRDTVHKKAQLLSFTKPVEADRLLAKLTFHSDKIGLVRYVDRQIDALLNEEKGMSDKELGFEGRGKIRTWNFMKRMMLADQYDRKDSCYDGYDEFNTDFVKDAIVWKGKFKSKGWAGKVGKEKVSELIAAAEEGTEGIEVWMPDAESILITDGEHTVRINPNEHDLNTGRMFVREGQTYTVTGIEKWTRDYGSDNIRYMKKPERQELIKKWALGLKQVFFKPHTLAFEDKEFAGYMMVEEASNLPIGWFSAGKAGFTPSRMLVNCTPRLDEEKNSMVVDFEVAEYLDVDEDKEDEFTVEHDGEVIATFDELGWNVTTTNKKLKALAERHLTTFKKVKKHKATAEARNLKSAITGYVAA